MTCDEFWKLASSGRPLPEEASRHLSGCSACSSTNRMMNDLSEPAESVDPGTERRIIAAITRDLQPVRPLAPRAFYLFGVITVLIAVALVGIRLLGIAGWVADTFPERGYFIVCFALAAGILATSVSHLMTPGAPVHISPDSAFTISTVMLWMGTLFYPLQNYDSFGHAILMCTAIGLMHEASAALLILIAIRRGAFLRTPQMIISVAGAGAMAGSFVLFIFCPHRDLVHIGVAHVGGPAVGVAAALGFGAILRHSGSRSRL